MSRAAGKAPAPRRKARSSAAGSAAEERIAVIDIGSNSIRLVVFQGRQRVPTPFFNEKVICGLGREIGASGALSEEGVELALVNLQRFARTARGMGVNRITLLATAAAREASNGPDFIAEVKRQTGHPVRLLSGEEEARISAQGVLAGLPEADGIMGDLGGGSLELVELDAGRLGRSVTLPLGPLRVLQQAHDEPQAVAEEIARHLEGVAWLSQAEGKAFYAVGGAWRALARIMMDHMDYPLHVIHGFTVPRREVDKTMRVLGRLGKSSLEQISIVSRRRLETVPYAAELLRSVLRRAHPERVVWSSYGLREGFLFDRLPAKERARDPLLATAQDLAREGRFPEFGNEIAEWTDSLFAEDENPRHRLRASACHLSDIAWREHPDYRARQALWRILHFPFAGVDHVDRAFLAYAVFTRYGGTARSEEVETALALLPAKAKRRARTLGLAMRLAYTLSAGVAGLLEQTALELREGELRLFLPGDGRVPIGEAVERRFEALVGAADVEDGFIDWQ